MPGPTKSQRTEAKYNVSLDFPQLGLHSAAATGNLGLVVYALDHGQPVNSVVDGVLPLHVACSGGNELVVRLLIERGADVNAPRLPRKHVSDRHRDHSAPIVGSSGSTPLHFAAANGHEAVVRQLLHLGAYPDRPDKHGVTAEMVARQNGWTDVANLLREWCLNRHKDIRAREVLPATSEDSDPFESKGTERRLRMKRSIDHKLNLLKQACPPSSTSSRFDIVTAPATMEHAISFGSSIDYPNTDEFPPRRPSLPHIFDSLQPPLGHHKPKRPSFSSTRRPRSAGTDAEPSSAIGAPGKLRGKLSLLHMKLKKSAGESSAHLVDQSGSTPPASSGSPRPPGSVSTSPTLERAANSYSPFSRGSQGTPSSELSRTFASADSSSTALSNPPLAVDLHRALSNERLRARAESAASEVAAPIPSPDTRPPSIRSPPVRPGILRPHGRSASSSQSQVEGGRSISNTPSLRALRFDDSASPSPRRHGLAVSTSKSSLKEDKDGESASPARQPLEFDEEDEEGYGEVISPRLGSGKSRLSEIKMEGRPRRLSSPQPSPSSADYPFSIATPPPPDETPNLLGIHVPGKDNRARGDSFGSMSTDVSSSDVSGYVMTPSASHAGLPDGARVRVSSGGSAAALDLDSYVDEKDAEREPRARSFSSSRGRARVGSPLRTPMDIDIHAISSHAQAEALVQQAQQCILELELDPDGTGAPLSARLAAYGESLAIERKFKDIEEGRGEERPRSPSRPRKERSPSATREREKERRLKSSQSSRELDSKYDVAEPSQPRKRRPRRPHTADSETTAPTSQLIPRHKQSLSSSVLYSRPSVEITTTPSVFVSSPPPIIIPPSPEATEPTPVAYRSFSRTPEPDSRLNRPIRSIRSRTPEPTSRPNYPTYGYGRESLDLPTMTRGEPLSRVSTAPSVEMAPKRSVSDEERMAARTNKLARMGIGVGADAGAQESGAWPTHSRRDGSKHRFGGIRTLVASLKGK